MGRSLRSRGFTLIEIISVVAMIGLLSAIVVVSVARSQDNNQEAIALQSIEAVTVAQIDFARRYGVFTAWPSDLELPDGPEVRVSASTDPKVVSVAVATDGTIGIAAGNGRNRCILRSVESLIAGGEITDRRAGPNQGCEGATAIGEDRSITAPASRIPS